jgi:hypothetical protein
MLYNIIVMYRIRVNNYDIRARERVSQMTRLEKGKVTGKWTIGTYFPVSTAIVVKWYTSMVSSLFQIDGLKPVLEF